MTDGPRRLNKSGGLSQRLLDSASLDKPSHTSRRHAENLASTASAFSSTRHGPSAVVRPLNPVRTLATWISIGAAASVALGFVASTLLQPTPAPQAATPLATVPSPTPRPATPSDISAEPAAPANTAKPSTASPEELREIEAARAALIRSDAATAITHLNAYDSAHPNGTLKPESMALRIQVLSSSGKTTEARTLANEFEEKYPSHPLLQQVRGGVAK